MKWWQIEYENGGSCAFFVKAKTQDGAVRKFREVVGYYTIKSVKAVY